MSMQSLGDLAQDFVNRRQVTVLKRQMTQLTSELSTGRTADVSRHLKASFGQLADIEHQIKLQQGHRIATAEAATFTAAMQGALGVVQAQAVDLADLAVVATSAAAGGATESFAENARGALDVIVGALNTDVAGRPLFAGTDYSNTPLTGAGELLAQARAALGGATDAPGIRAALDTFFGVGGGFETQIYQGGSENVAPYRLGAGESVQLSLRADDVTFRGVLKSAVMASLTDDPALDAATRRALAGTAADGLLAQSAGVTRIQADLGYAEERIERSSVRIASELTSLDYARGLLLGADPFEVATELENVQFRLEALYTITARAARLNLMNFLS